MTITPVFRRGEKRPGFGARPGSEANEKQVQTPRRIQRKCTCVDNDYGPRCSIGMLSLVKAGSATQSLHEAKIIVLVHTRTDG